MTAAQKQRLREGLLQPIMPLLYVAIFVGLAGLNFLSVKAIMAQQRFIATGKLRLAPFLDFLDRGRYAIAAVNGRHASHLPQRLLQADAQTLEAF